MKIIAVDDEIPALTILKRSIEAAVINADVICFEYAEKALEYAKQHTIDIAFIDIEMPVMNGLSLAKNLKELCAKTNIIFVSGYNQYMGDAFKLRVSGYILKPIDPEQVKDEIENLRIPIKPRDQDVYIQCFGNFEIYVNGTPVVFARSKSKEFLAYLVDKKGLAVTKKEVAAVLLEKDDYTLSIQSYVHTIIAEASRVLIEVGVGDILIKQRGNYHIDMTKVRCDYYDYHNGNIDAINRYQGEYMAHYSWAEFTINDL